MNKKQIQVLDFISLLCIIYVVIKLTFFKTNNKVLDISLSILIMLYIFIIRAKIK